MNCPACTQALPRYPMYTSQGTGFAEVCDEWCAYTMRERWDAIGRTRDALESAAKKLVMEQAMRDPSYAQWVAQQIFARQQAQMGAPGWLQQMMMQGHQVGLGPVTFGEKIP